MTEGSCAHITRGVPLSTDSASIVSRLDALVRRRNFNPHPACRYSKYRETLLARAEGAPPKVTTEEQLYATGELYQLEWIVSCYVDDDEGWPMVERALFQDPTIPTGAVNSPGRDIQFELYVGARLKIAGLSPSFGEPDIHATLSGWPFCIAAKRVKSRRTLMAAIRGARDQIKKTAIDGLIALDYSYIAASENLAQPTRDLDAAHAWAESFSVREFHARLPSILNVVSHVPETFGLLAFARLFHLHPDRHTHIISELHFGRSFCRDGDFRAEKLAAIQECLRTSVLP